MLTAPTALVTLTPVGISDDVGERHFTLSPKHLEIPIGRSSKTEAKRIIARHDNAWIDSLVMSRSHAVLSIPSKVADHKHVIMSQRARDAPC